MKIFIKLLCLTIALVLPLKGFGKIVTDHSNLNLEKKQEPLIKQFPSKKEIIHNKKYKNSLTKRNHEKTNTFNITPIKDKLSKEEVAEIVSMAGFPKKIVSVITCIAKYESNFTPKAVNIYNTNNTKDHGLFQINDIWLSTCKVTAKQLRNPLINAKCAYKIYKIQGFRAWSSFNQNREKCMAYKINPTTHQKLAEIDELSKKRVN